MAGGDRDEKGQVGGPFPAPAMCAPPKSCALVLWLPFEVKVSDELECAVMLLLSSGVASKTPSLFQPPARLFLFWAFPSFPACSHGVFCSASFLFFSLWQNGRQGQNRREGLSMGKAQRKKENWIQQQTDTFLSTFGDFFSTFCDPLLSFRCCQVPSLSFRPRSADFSQRSLSLACPSFFLSSFHHAIPF